MKGRTIMANKDYSVTIAKATKELTKLEQLMFSQSPDSYGLDELTAHGAAYINVDYAVQLSIHNEKNTSGDKDYTTTYIVDTDGAMYRTSSTSFTTNLFDIAEMFEDELQAGQPFPTIKVFQKPSKNMKGKNFITCTVWAGPIPEPVVEDEPELPCN